VFVLRQRTLFSSTVHVVVLLSPISTDGAVLLPFVFDIGACESRKPILFFVCGAIPVGNTLMLITLIRVEVSPRRYVSCCLARAPQILLRRFVFPLAEKTVK
jgi:hypothetical protein